MEKKGEHSARQGNRYKLTSRTTSKFHVLWPNRKNTVTIIYSILGTSVTWGLNGFPIQIKIERL
jgi:hypothetical protein